ncbi:MAG TPA: ribosome maturation factor RimM [Bacillota bacterium]|nr:ribosome maturation factor RimM [Bacillota bacterium]
MNERLFDVGKIVNTHGIKGEVKIISFTDFPEERYRKNNNLLLSHPSLSEPIPVTVESARFHKNSYIVKFRQFNNINEVEKFKGGMVKVAEGDRQELEEDTFYYDEIIGCNVISDTGERLGQIHEILATGANDVWVVKNDQGKEILLPYIEECILEVDVEEKIIKVHIMEGLVE